MRSAVLAVLLAGVCSAASAQVTVPNTFSAGAPARAADVNANFQALATAVNGLAGRVARLEGQVTAADLVGTYTINYFQTEMVGAGGNSHVASYAAGGTATLAANGVATLSPITEVGHQLNFTAGGGGSRTPINRTDTGGVVSWSLSGGTVRMFDRNFTIADGGRLLILTTSNPADGSTVLFLLTRTN